MVIKIFFFKLKSLVLLIVSVINKALCCFRRRRCDDNVVLTHVVSNRDGIPDGDDWSNWIDENSENQKPKTVQDHIEMYRKQIASNLQKQEENEEHHLNFFEDMAPKIIKQTKHLIKPSVQENGTSNRLNFEEDAFTSVPTKELGEWEESSGWEGETLDWDAQQALREKKRQDRERKALEKMQKRQEKMNRSLGARVNS